MNGRTIVVGDIHGCYDELMDLLEKCGFSQDDRVVAVGDLITKGPKNREVLDLFMTDPRFSTVIGNHDLALRRKWSGEKVKLKSAQKATHKELKPDKEIYAGFFNRVPFIIDLGTHLVVHAGLRPNVELYSQTTCDMTVLRTLGKTARRGMTFTMGRRSCSSDTGPRPNHDAPGGPSASIRVASMATT